MRPEYYSISPLVKFTEVPKSRTPASVSTPKLRISASLWMALGLLWCEYIFGQSTPIHYNAASWYQPNSDIFYYRWGDGLENSILCFFTFWKQIPQVFLADKIEIMQMSDKEELSWGNWYCIDSRYEWTTSSKKRLARVSNGTPKSASCNIYQVIN